MDPILNRNFTGLPKNYLSMMNKSTLELWEKYSKVDENDVEVIEKSLVKHASSTLARTAFNMDALAAYHSAAYSVRDRLIEIWNETQQFHTLKDQKRVYYLSMEFLLGRSLDNALINLGLRDSYATALKALGFNLEDVINEERDAALGNGGLGRLAACFMDSLACLEMPAWGYGLRYNYGIFKQKIISGFQCEFPDFWLNVSNPWEVARFDVSYEVRFYGHVSVVNNRSIWQGGEVVQAVAYDIPIPGYKNKTCLNIRLWSSKPSTLFDLQSFNAGDYEQSVREQQRAESITSVLYPNDNHMLGKELRLKQEYFFSCATLKDIVRRFKKTNRPWSEFSDQVAIQLNDTHPTLSIPELMRRFIDVEQLEWDAAFSIVSKVFSFTNHTVLPEALERWSVALMGNLLPRHLEIIFELNSRFLKQVELHYKDILSVDQLNMVKSQMSLIEEGSMQYIRMAHLAIIGSHTVNGVAALHSELVKYKIFNHFNDFYPNKFTNITNGITPRRWLNQANPQLSRLITKTLKSDAWITDLSLLSTIKTNDEFVTEFSNIKYENKIRLAIYVQKECNIKIVPEALFDIQVKRIHEYKRQFMNIIQIIYSYLTILDVIHDPSKLSKIVPRVCIFGGKAAPGYYMAKLVIKLINSVANVVNNDSRINDLLKVVFIPDYNVSNAEIIIPASDLSQHISTAGTEASGTSNMKFILNGGLIIGTIDGANVEIKEQVSEENIYTFGTLADKVQDKRNDNKANGIKLCKELEMVIKSIQMGEFGDCNIFNPLLDTLLIAGDYYLINEDFRSYLSCMDRVMEGYKNKKEWTRKSILNMCRAGFFSADRSIKEYGSKIWKIKPVQVPEDWEMSTSVMKSIHGD
eukprot:NODE_383_length_9627_cov_0.480793.p1 type:complete len:863 gc:universal NODE_383_length_9627_cov_0.480793:1583-4171(+)